MKNLMYLLPLAVLLTLVSCSDEEAKSEKTVETEKKEPKPLLEREPEVKDYLEITTEIVNEYVAVCENLLTTLEKLDAGELGLMEAAKAAQNLLDSWESIEELEHTLAQQEGVKKSIESRLNTKDIAEFSAMYLETVERVDSLKQRIESSNLNKYLK